MDQHKANPKKLPLEKLFDEVVYFASVLIVIDGFDGKEAWERLKKILAQYDNFRASSWILTDTLKQVILYHLEPVENMIDKPKEKKDCHHFLRQHVRMTCKLPTLEFIIQLAFNIGQWMGKPDEKIIKGSSYKEWDLHNLFRYISRKDAERFQMLPCDWKYTIKRAFSGNILPD